MYLSKTRRKYKSTLLYRALLIVEFVLLPCTDATGFACETTKECEALVRKGSECLDTGYCSNPFHKGGCLANMLQEYRPNITKKFLRVCGSDDPQEAEALGYCASGKEWDHLEIRFMGNNWESAFFANWIMQILLSEILGVPTSVDTGFPDKVLDFYDVQSRMDYGKGFNADALRVAGTVGDCRLLQQSENASEYKQCSHVNLETWESRKEQLLELEREALIEKPMAAGLLGLQGLHIPTYTAERDPSLMSFFGLQGEQNRRKLANMFKRPTEWGDYCTQVSLTNCTVPDDVAQRPPKEGEESRMFAPGVYTGHFRKTEENDCEKHPFTCTGHVADYPCGWANWIQQWFYHLNISLKSSGKEPGSNGYSYSQLTEIWAAANATKSDVMLYWWTPEALVSKYAGTDSDFQRITFPRPTKECTENRISNDARCGDDPVAKVGSAEGVCDEEPQNLVKAWTSNIFEISYGDHIPEGKRSPSYSAIKKFELKMTQLGDLFHKWLVERGRDKWNYDPREAVCEWVVENFDVMESFIPRSYPRVMKDGKKDALNHPLMYASLIIAGFSLAFVLTISAMVYKYRARKVMVVAQVEFLFFLLLGLTMVQFASIFLAIPPTDPSCILAVWFKNLGYTLELVPLIVKVSAINRLLSASRKMKRTKIDRTHLFYIVAVFFFIVAVYLTIWTIIDPPKEKDGFELTKKLDEHGDTIVMVNHYCASENDYWRFAALVWRSLLLLWATVLAFQTRNSPNHLNETKPLAIMVYSQFSFLIWNLVIFFLEESVQVAQVGWYQSLIHSFDVAAVCCIYFVPKLITTDEKFRQRQANRSSLRVSGISLGSNRLQNGDSHFSHSQDGTGSLNFGTNALRKAFESACSSMDDMGNDSVGADIELTTETGNNAQNLDALDKKLQEVCNLNRLRNQTRVENAGDMSTADGIGDLDAVRITELSGEVIGKSETVEYQDDLQIHLAGLQESCEDNRKQAGDVNTDSINRDMLMGRLVRHRKEKEGEET